MADALIAAIAAADQRAVVDLLKDMPEAERRERAPGMLKLELDQDASESVALRQIAALQLALAGTATLSELRRLGAWDALLHLDEQLGAEVLLDRRPGSLAKWADWILTAEEWRPKWALVHTLVQAGAIDRPADPAYLDALLAASYGGGAAELLAREPALAWELLAFHGGRNSLRSADDRRAGWREAIIASVDDRERLLDAALDALSADLSAHRAVWYTGLWKALEPTREERAAREDRLRAGLGAAAAPVVTFTVEELLKAKVDVPAAELGPALTAHAKKTVRAALRLLDRSEDAEAASIALAHTAAEIQGEVLDRLERWGLTDAARDALVEHLDLLAATQRPRAEALLGFSAPTDEPSALADLEARVDAIPEPIRIALGFGGPVPVAPVPGEPVLGEPIVPIASLEELADELVAAVADEADDERVLDGVLRFCDQPFDGPLAPLADRLDVDRSSHSVTRVAAAWCHRRAPAPPTVASESEHRLAAAAVRAANGDARPLVALPSHAGGWIEPSALVARMKRELDEHEFAQALLRLAPEGRAEALAEAQAILGTPGEILRCALGGDPVADTGPAAGAARAVRVPPLDDVRVGVRIFDQQHMAERLDYLSDVAFGRIADTEPKRSPPAPGPVGQQLAIATPHDFRDLYAQPEPFGWPSRRDVACAAAISRLGWTLETGTSWDTGAAELLELLQPATEPLCPFALRLATLALGSNDEREHLLALDLLIAAVEDGRVDAPALAPGVRKDLGSGLLLTNRLGARLSTLAGAGTLHRAVARDLLDAIVDVLEPLSRRTYIALLDPFDELCAQTNTRVQCEPARAFLQTLTGSSKAAKAAGSLLARDGAPPPEERQLALAARVSRAQRWIG